MRYGLTRDQAYQQRKVQEKLEREQREKWRVRFAWLPVRLNDGRNVWLERYNFREKWIEVNDFSSRCWPGFYTDDREPLD